MPNARIALLLLAAPLVAAPLSAQVLRVQAGAPPGGNGTSWGNAIGDLQTALALAASDPLVVEVWVAAGRYLPASVDRTQSFAVPNGVGLYGGFAGTETVRGQRDPVANVTVLDGDLAGNDLPGLQNYGENSWHVVTAVGVQSLVLDGFTIRGGSRGGGAGVRAIAQQVELANLRLVENWGLDNNNDGAGLWLAADLVQVRACVFADNLTTAGAGAQLLDGPLAGPKQASFEACVFERNQATDGAGIRATGVEPWSVTLVDCTFRDGYGTSGAGVTVHADGPSELVARDCVFEGNAACAGGGLFLSDTLAELQRCRFRGNGVRGGCGFGAGGGAVKSVGGSLEVLDSTFQDDRRGAVWVEGLGSSLASTTFSCATGVGIRVQSGTVQLENCIVWGATSPQVTLGQGASVSATHSDVRMSGSGLPGAGNLELDPLFVDAAAGDLHLSVGSPCVDAGNPLLAQPGPDFERDSRVVDGDLDGTPRVDMGADELGPAHLEVLGTPAPGNTLTIVTSSPPGLSAVLLFGRPGVRQFPQLGTLFVNLNGAHASVWPATGSVPVVVPPGVGGLFHTQLILFGGGVALPSNYVPLQF
jgi:hypothetical protein